MKFNTKTALVSVTAYTVTFVVFSRLFSNMQRTRTLIEQGRASIPTGYGLHYTGNKLLLVEHHAPNHGAVLARPMFRE